MSLVAFVGWALRNAAARAAIEPTHAGGPRKARHLIGRIDGTEMGNRPTERVFSAQYGIVQL